MSTMSKSEMSIKMSNLSNEINKLELKTQHEFDSPKTRKFVKSKSNQFYSTCCFHLCGRSVFDDGTGSATTHECTGR